MIPEHDLIEEVENARKHGFELDLYPSKKSYNLAIRACLKLDNDDPIQCFDLNADINEAYPNVCPTVVEKGERITGGEDGFHINPDGSLCLGEPNEIETIFKKSKSIIGLLQDLVLPFLSKFLFWEKTNIDLGLRHGGEGILDYYREKIGDIDSQTLFQLLYAKYIKKMNPNAPCPCGKGTKFKRCHGPKLELLESAHNRDTAIVELHSLSLILPSKKQEP